MTDDTLKLRDIHPPVRVAPTCIGGAFRAMNPALRKGCGRQGGTRCSPIAKGGPAFNGRSSLNAGATFESERTPRKAYASC
jgi:hypothetical protein